MLYLSRFTFPDGDDEFDFRRTVKRTCYDSLYPFGVLSAKGLLIQEWNAAYCVPQDEFNRLGKAGSPTNVKHILSVVLTAGNFQEVAPTPEAVGNLVHELIEDHTLG